jgi:Domain of unknown function (DUF6597)
MAFAGLSVGSVYRGFADGSAELIFHYGSAFYQLIGDKVERSFAAAIYAQTRKHTRFIVDRSWGIFGCYLYPLALTRLFSFPASDFTDTLTDFHSLLGPYGRELEDRMLMASDNHHRVEILSTFLQKRLELNKREEPRVFASVSHIINTRGFVNVTSLAREHFLSKRQFERKFKEFSGFSPRSSLALAAVRQRSTNIEAQNH